MPEIEYSKGFKKVHILLNNIVLSFSWHTQHFLLYIKVDSTHFCILWQTYILRDISYTTTKFLSAFVHLKFSFNFPLFNKHATKVQYLNNLIWFWILCTWFRIFPFSLSKTNSIYCLYCITFQVHTPYYLI